MFSFSAPTPSRRSPPPPSDSRLDPVTIVIEAPPPKPVTDARRRAVVQAAFRAIVRHRGEFTTAAAMFDAAPQLPCLAPPLISPEATGEGRLSPCTPASPDHCRPNVDEMPSPAKRSRPPHGHRQERCPKLSVEAFQVRDQDLVVNKEMLKILKIIMPSLSRDTEDTDAQSHDIELAPFGQLAPLQLKR
ncbi:hypothetical protein J5N97_030051 [Dioscorea zingiberensis]|uniref:Uncharacterized protein n=1 Tax=Dioscorea zingiberensis TaxID=325984 RepID=A0A9D5H3S0_9LILI|nr:hypothetical protein J5N97_030051 [Dioscorea zingiberensis]